MIYVQRTNGKEHGSVTTKKEIADFMLDLCNYTSSRNLSKIKILDPCAGEGIFIITAMERLFKSSLKFDFDFLNAVRNLMAIEIDEEKSHQLTRRISRKIKDLGFKNFAIKNLVLSKDFLTKDIPTFDVIIGNPPYVRHENIPYDKKIHYRNQFQLFRHRSDIYVAFFEKALNNLSKTGQLCFICPDRWLKNKYGENLRNHMSEKNGIPAIVNLNEMSVFEEEVFGYPVIILVNTDTSQNNINYFDIHDISHLKSVLLSLKNKKIRNKGFVHTKIRKPKLGDQWILDKRKITLKPENFSKIEDQGFKIGIGVATGADSVFIGQDLKNKIEKKRLVPIILSKDIKKGKICWSGNYVLNPFEKDGTAIELKKYPAMKKYLYSNKEKLKKRYVAKKNPANKWYKTIDRIYTDLTKKPKLLLPDLKKNEMIVMDTGKYYPHHNLYHITNDSIVDLKILGAILMSKFSLNQLSAVSVHMRGGYPRWQAQNLRKIIIPQIRTMPENIKKKLVNLFDKKDVEEINSLLENYMRI